jgi:D-3-phosphoglycerate dehydrogenase
LLASEGNADQPQFADRLAEMDYIVSAVMPFQRPHVERASRLKLLHKLGVGYNELDLTALRERAIQVAVCPVGVSDAVPEHTLALTLAAIKCIPNLDLALRTKEWPSWSYRTRIRSLAGRRVGIVGFGRIGQPTAALFVAFGCQVEVFSRTRPTSLPEQFGRFQEQGVLSFTDDLVGMFERCSVVSLHAPLTDATRDLVTEAMLEKLGPEGVFVNTARGALVDEAALARTLGDGRLGCAGLDVFREEPSAPHPDLLACPNVVMSPHVAGGGSDVLERKVGFIVQNLRSFHEAGTARELLSF